MLLRSPISGAKKFFSKTFKSFKSFFNGDSYEKLPKATTQDHTTPCTFTLNPNPRNPNLHQHRVYDSRKLYISEKWDSDTGTRKKKIATEQDKEVVPLKKFNRNHQKKSNVVERTKEGEGPSCSRSRGSGSVLKKLKELEMMDRSNIDHVKDIEEVLHYYSLLTCPLYVEIVDKFFVEIFKDLFVYNTTQARRTPSNPSSRVRNESRVLPKVRLTEPPYGKYN